MNAGQGYSALEANQLFARDGYIDLNTPTNTIPQTRIERLRQPARRKDDFMSAEPPAKARAARHFGASPERVCDAWLDPEKVRA